MGTPAQSTSRPTGRWTRSLKGVKVLFLLNRKEGTCARWRVRQLVPHLAEQGVECTLLEIPPGSFARLATAKKAAAHDVVVLQKRLLPKLVLQRLRWNAKHLIYEFDDPVMLKKSGQGFVHSITRERRFQRTLQLADAVVTSSPHLAGLAKRHAPDPTRVELIPTAVDLHRWTPRPDRRPLDGPVILGWVGSTVNFPNLEVLRAPLIRLARTHDIRLRTLGRKPVELPGVPLEHRPFHPDTEVAETRGFDIALCPLIDDSWTRGRSPTPILASFAAGLPVVASDIPPYRELIRNGENGFLCGTLSQWEQRLTSLIENPDLRREIGRQARETVERDHSLSVAVEQYLRLLRKMTG